MNTERELVAAADKVTSLFTFSEGKRSLAQRNRSRHQHFMRLNFILLTHFMKQVHKKSDVKEHEFSFFPLFTSKILASENAHLVEITKQAESCCSKQDFHLMPYKQFLLRNELTFKRVIEWKLSKYVKTKSQLDALYSKMKESSPDVFKRHLVTLIKSSKSPEAELTEKEANEAAKRQEDTWKLYRHHADGGPSRVSPT